MFKDILAVFSKHFLVSFGLDVPYHGFCYKGGFHQEGRWAVEDVEEAFFCDIRA